MSKPIALMTTLTLIQIGSKAIIIIIIIIIIGQKLVEKYCDFDIIIITTTIHHLHNHIHHCHHHLLLHPLRSRCP